MTITAPAPIPTTAAPLRLPAWLLALSPLGYVAAIGLAFPIVLILMPGLGLLDDITRTQMDHFATGWVLMNVAQLLSGVGVVGLLLVGLRITGRGRPWGLAAVVLAGLALVGLVVGVGLRIAATGFTSDRLADDGRYAVGTWLAASMVLPMVSTVLLCIALRLSAPPDLGAHHRRQCGLAGDPRPGQLLDRARLPAGSGNLRHLAAARHPAASPSPR